MTGVFIHVAEPPRGISIAHLVTHLVRWTA
jgi:hypothetical protein